MGAGPDGSLYAHWGYSGIARSQDEGETWQIVAGVEGYNGGYFNVNCFAVSPEGRIFVFDDDHIAVVYSDDNGDTWQPTTQLSSCAMSDISGLYAVTNNVFIVWTQAGEFYWTTDGGETWGYTILDLDENHQVSDLIVNVAGDVYVGVWSYGGEGSGIFHSTLSDMQNWTLAAFEGAAVQDMVLHPDGSIVAGSFWGGISGFQHEPGFYLIDAMKDEIAISDNGITYCLEYYITPEECTFVLAYSEDYGEHLYDIGESFEIAFTGGGRDGNLYKGYDNYLYLFVNGQYYKSINEADMIVDPMGGYFPRGTEWYYEIKHLTGGITYQYLEYTADTAVNSKRVKIIAETNTMYDKEQWTDFEYIYEDGDRIYWWNKDLEDFTLLYDFGAEVGDEWEINGGWFTITVHVDAAQTVTFKSQPYRVLSVSDASGLFTGDIICGIGHQERFFPESPIAKDYEVDGLRCFWQDGELVLTMGDEDCDAVYYEIHDVDEDTEATFAVYPNPTDGLLFVEGQGEYRLTNPLGQILLLGTTTKTIDVSSLPAGLYFLTIGNQTQKIIINRIP